MYAIRSYYAQGQTHRALDDAEQTVELFLALRERALALEYGLLEEIRNNFV